jgi:molybdopterin/thiamine biosynthesis adenylyltransferase
MTNTLTVQQLHNLPEYPDRNTLYDLLPKNFSLDYYRERTDRNGWISQYDQESVIHKATVVIFGCGGMGGLIAAILTRLGVGTVIIIEPEDFDVSNINRQFAATSSTVGKSKAFETARMVRDIASDTRLIVCPQGLTEETLEVLTPYLVTADVFLDEIEFWAIGARLTVHELGWKLNIPILNCNTVGFRTNLWCFTRAGMPLSEAMDIHVSDAWMLQKRIQGKKATAAEIDQVMEKVMKIFLPEIPEYSLTPTEWSTKEQWYKRLREEGKANVISTNPPKASGFVSNHTLFQLLTKKSKVTWKFVLPPPMPGYLMFDSASMTSSIVTAKWW